MHLSRLRAGALALALATAAVAAPPLAILGAGVATAATVDLTPIVDYGLDIVFGLLASLLLAGVGWVVGEVRAYFKAKLGVDLAILQTRDNGMLHAGIGRIVAAIEARSRETVFGPDGKVAIGVDHPLVAEAMATLAQRSPDLLKRLGVTEEALRATIADRFGLDPFLVGPPLVGELASAAAPIVAPFDPAGQLERLTAAARGLPAPAGIPAV